MRTDPAHHFFLRVGIGFRIWDTSQIKCSIFPRDVDDDYDDLVFMPPNQSKALINPSIYMIARIAKKAMGLMQNYFLDYNTVIWAKSEHLIMFEVIRKL